MQIIAIGKSSVERAGRVHCEAWRSSHAGFCTAEFLKTHTPRTQTKYLTAKLDGGAKIFMLTDCKQDVGIVSVCGDLIEDLYVLPQFQCRGYGTRLLLYALSLCGGAARLWVLGNNTRAAELYIRHGFEFTGASHALTATLSELEMRRQAAGQIKTQNL